MLKPAAAAFALLGFAALAACGDHPNSPSPDQLCQTAVYRLADGRVLDIAPSDGGDLRWRMGDGRTGRLSAKDGWKSTLGWTKRPTACASASAAATPPPSPSRTPARRRSSAPACRW